MTVKYVRPSVYTVVCGTFVVFVFALISSVGVQHCDAFILALGSGVPQRGKVKLIYVCVRLSMCLSLFMVVHVAFWQSKCTAHNCVQRMRLQATG